jgi:hypothetical protein
MARHGYPEGYPVCPSQYNLHIEEKALLCFVKKLHFYKAKWPNIKFLVSTCTPTVK